MKVNASLHHVPKVVNDVEWYIVEWKIVKIADSCFGSLGDGR